MKHLLIEEFKFQKFEINYYLKQVKKQKGKSSNKLEPEKATFHRLEQDKSIQTGTIQ